MAGTTSHAVNLRRKNEATLSSSLRSAKPAATAYPTTGAIEHLIADPEVHRKGEAQAYLIGSTGPSHRGDDEECDEVLKELLVRPRRAEMTAEGDAHRTDGDQHGGGQARRCSRHFASEEKSGVRARGAHRDRRRLPRELGGPPIEQANELHLQVEHERLDAPQPIEDELANVPSLPAGGRRTTRPDPEDRRRRSWATSARGGRAGARSKRAR
jgi:hypothetical protein